MVANVLNVGKLAMKLMIGARIASCVQNAEKLGPVLMIGVKIVGYVQNVALREI